MDEAILKTLTPVTRKIIEALASTPGDCVQVYNRLTIIRGGIRIGVEVMQHNLAAKTQAARKKLAEMPTQMSLGEMAEVGALERGIDAALSVATALECAMGLLEAVHGKDTFRASVTTSERMALDPDDITKRVLAGESYESIAKALGVSAEDVKRATRLRKLDLD